MKRIRKFLIRSFALAMLTMLVVGGVLGGFGYKMYRDALAEQPLEEKVAEIQADPDYTTLAEIPEIYLDAVVAVEDHRFERHFGIDLIAIGRAAWNNLTSWSLREGGSTITQQLAKNIYFIDMNPFSRKLAEIFMAFAIEDNYSKEEILELYVNTSYFGDGYYGIKEACNGYLDKEPSEMNLNECTMMAGIPNAPSVYAPTKNPDLTKSRQEHVLETMVENGYISQEKAEEIINANT